MLAKVHSAGVLGVDAFLVCAEVEVSGGLPGYHLVGLGAGAVKEGAVRVRAALEHSGWKLSAKKVTVNLAPADIRKDGAAFDLPIAVGILAAQEVIPRASLEGVVLLGELSLDGALRRVAGGLPVALWARQRGVRAIVLPAASAPEAAAISGVPVYAASSLAEVAAHLAGGAELRRAEPSARAPSREEAVDLADVRGQEFVKLALEVAAAGGHNLLMVGPPGAGKSMLARRLPTILPPLTETEAVETSAIYSAAGKLDGGLLTERPFRAPHHDVSVAGLVGGGPVPRPGEISLAHHGVLFLDELLEFQRGALEALRQPLEERAITLVRARASVRFPASFALVAAMNPCPCGYWGSSVRTCTCSLERVRRYRARLSGPLLDRFDLQVFAPHVDYRSLSEAREGEPSAVVRERVLAARARQQARLRRHGLGENAQLGPRLLPRYCSLDAELEAHLGEVARRRGLSLRAVHRLLRVARTLADLGGRERISAADLFTAIEFRFLDQETL